MTARYLEYSQFGYNMYKAGIFKTPQYMSRNWEIMNDTILHSSMKILPCLFDSISSLCKQHNIELKVIIIPYFMQYDRKIQNNLCQLKEHYGYCPGYNFANDSLKMLLDSKSIENCYPIDILKREHEKQPIVYKYDEHFNKRGHDIISHIILRMLTYKDSSYLNRY